MTTFSRRFGLIATVLCVMLLAASSFLCQKWQSPVKLQQSLKMGLGDILSKAFANDPSLPPAQNAGLNKKPELVEIEFLPAKKVK